MYNRKFTPAKGDKPTTELFMDAVLERQACRHHKAEKGQPCGWMGPFRAICNKRAKAAGFNHPIHPGSLRLNRQNKK